MGRFSGKVAVVTGGGSGIGAATALAFSREGAQVIVADFNEQGGHKTVERIQSEGGSALFVQTDVSKETDVANLFARTEEVYGRVDVVHANAGIFNTTSVSNQELENWSKIIEVNLTGVMLTNKYAVLSMLKTGGGAIVNTASIAGLIAWADSTAYCASKGGVVMLTKNTAIDYAKKGIRVNAVCPGAVDTPMVQGVIDKAGSSENQSAARKAFEDMHPMGRLAKPEEIANAVLFLASDEASFITGQTLAVDGGYTAA